MRQSESPSGKLQAVRPLQHSMQILELIRSSYRLCDSLRFRYKVFLFWPWLVCFFAMLPLWRLGVYWLAHSLGLENDMPVRGHPSEVTFLVSMFGMLVLVIIVASLVSGTFNAICLKYFGKWSWPKIRKLLIESEAPQHWLKTYKHR
jgi:hypothetical protein